MSFRFMADAKKSDRSSETFSAFIEHRALASKDTEEK